MERNEKFEKLLDLEFEATDTKGAVRMKREGMLQTRTPLATLRNEQRQAQAELFAAMAELTPAEMVEFGQYRLAAKRV
jgi:hypothetical protein